jgi:fatty acid desaturase
MFLNNGYHAEHHYRPKQHWTRMRELKSELRALAGGAGPPAIGPAHFLGFLDPATWRAPRASGARAS